MERKFYYIHTKTTTNTNITAPNGIMVTMIDIKVSKDKCISRWVNRVLFNKAGQKSCTKKNILINREKDGTQLT